jgi:tellurite methyltransferase
LLTEGIVVYLFSTQNDQQYLMQASLIHEVVGDTDIYLIDQILKGRYQPDDTILDAGCGIGRNMHWFLQNEFCIYGIDQNNGHITELKLDNPTLRANRLQVAKVELMPFGNSFFNHIISSAVLHFAESTEHFLAMLKEMVRVLKPKGSLFIRMTSDIGIEDKVKLVRDGVYIIPDTTTRFLLTKPLLQRVMSDFHLSLLEPLKTVNVNDVRCMSTLVLQKS